MTDRERHLDEAAETILRVVHELARRMTRNERLVEGEWSSPIPGDSHPGVQESLQMVRECSYQPVAIEMDREEAHKK
jgi:hypothetical protein